MDGVLVLVGLLGLVALYYQGSNRESTEEEEGEKKQIGA